MSTHYEKDLKQFSKDLSIMAALTEETIQKSIEALKSQDANLARAVIEADNKVDEQELRIEEQAIDLLALYQPLARDLRFITTGMKINAELERIADLAVNICQRVLEIADKPLLKPLVDIPRLSEIARLMVKNAIEAFVQQDKELARNVIISDVESDQIRNRVQQELVYDYMVKDGTTAPRAVALLLISRHLERICDHATYMAEDVIYMVEAKVVKHHPEKL